MSKIWQWIKDHPYMSLGLGAAIVLLIYLYTSSANAANNQAAATAAANAQAGIPSDAIMSQDIQTGAQLQALQIQASAQAAQDQLSAELQQEQLYAQVQANNANNQAALTLGLAQAGDSTSTILQLLGAQPNSNTSGLQLINPQGTAVVVNPTVTATTTPSTVLSTNATVMGANANYGGTGVNTQYNPAPAQYYGPPNTPVNQAIVNSNPDLHAMVSRTPQPQNPSTDPNTHNDVQLYEQDVTGTIAGGGSYPVSNIYYATPQAAADLAGFLSTTAVAAPSVVGASGGPFFNPPTEDIVTPSGTVDAGQMMNELQNTPPALWSTILGGYGIQDTASVTSSIYNMFGANQAIPQTSAGAAE